MSAGETKVREALRLAAHASEVATRAQRSKQSLRGSSFYGQRFQSAEIQLTALLRELPAILSQVSIPTPEAESFLEMLRTVAAAETPLAARPPLLRRLRLLGESAILPALAKAEIADEPVSQTILPLSVVDGTRGYIRAVTLQANGCYEHGWHDAASVMIRKLIEILIIEVYEATGRASTIKNPSGDFLMLGDLVDKLLADPSWNLSRETKVVLPRIKSLGDRAAHNRRFVAKKQDVDNIISGLRVAVDDLLHISGLK